MVKLGIDVSEFNQDITTRMFEKAKAHASSLGVEVKEVAWVPGAFDTPFAVKNMLVREEVDAIVTLGAIIKGDTDHDAVIAQSTARKLIDLSLEYNKPVTLGIIGPNATEKDAIKRTDEYARRAVEAALKLVKK